MTDAVLDEILDELSQVDPTCSECHHDIVTPQQWRYASLEERTELLEEGYRRPGPRGMCRPCYDGLTPEERASRPRRAKSKSKPTDASITDAMLTDLELAYKDIGARGGAAAHVAAKYGVKPNTLTSAYRRRNGATS